MKQFQRLHQEMGEGGFSEHIPTETKPTPPGFMTSDFGTEEKIPSHLNSPQLIEAYATTQGLKTAPPGEFLGGWPYQGEDYLDRSRKYASRSAGTAAMALQNSRCAACQVLRRPGDVFSPGRPDLHCCRARTSSGGREPGHSGVAAPYRSLRSEP
jgi:hypothetical protein